MKPHKTAIFYYSMLHGYLDYMFQYKNIYNTCYGHCSKVEMCIFLQQYIWVHDTYLFI